MAHLKGQNRSHAPFMTKEYKSQISCDESIWENVIIFHTRAIVGRLLNVAFELNTFYIYEGIYKG